MDVATFPSSNQSAIICVADARDECLDSNRFSRGSLTHTSSARILSMLKRVRGIRLLVLDPRFFQDITPTIRTGISAPTGLQYSQDSIICSAWRRVAVSKKYDNLFFRRGVKEISRHRFEILTRIGRPLQNATSVISTVSRLHDKLTASRSRTDKVWCLLQSCDCSLCGVCDRRL